MTRWLQSARVGEQEPLVTSDWGNSASSQAAAARLKTVMPLWRANSIALADAHRDHFWARHITFFILIQLLSNNQHFVTVAINGHLAPYITAPNGKFQPVNAMSFFGGGFGLDSQLDHLQFALADAVATAHRTTPLGKREILVPLGGIIENRKMTLIDGKWREETKIETVEVTEKSFETQLLASGLSVYQEREKFTTKNKLRTTAEYIRIPKEADVFELSAPQGTPISDALLHALKANNPSAALTGATEAYWGDSKSQGDLQVNQATEFISVQGMTNVLHSFTVKKALWTLFRSSHYLKNQGSSTVSNTRPPKRKKTFLATRKMRPQP